MKTKKKISVAIPCYNEEKSVKKMYDRLTAVFKNKLQNYDYEIIYVDDCSKDNTWNEIKKVAKTDKHVKGVHNAKNFGINRNLFSTMLYGDGDATFMLFGDLQEPPEMLVDFVKEWENGHKVAIGQKVRSKENKIMYFIRKIYYKIMDVFSDTPQISLFNGFGLYDKSFIDVLRQIDDPNPYFKGIVAEFGMDVKILPYTQEKSLRGKSGFNFMSCYDYAMLGITSYTKFFMRIATFISVFLGFLSIILAIIVFINKLIHWDAFSYGTALILVCVLFISAVQLFFLGILGEYILNINTRSMKRPLVVIGEKVGFENSREK